MPELAWDINHIQAQEEHSQQLANALSNDRERVAWLIKQVAYLAASHMQLQQLRTVHSDGLAAVMNRANGLEQLQKIQVAAIAERLEALEQRA